VWERVGIQFLLFCAVGATGVAVDLAAVALVAPLAGYGVATVAAFLVATTWNYGLNYRVTWGRPPVRHRRAWARYVLTRSLPLCGRFLVVALLVERSGASVLVASVVGIGVAGVLGFVTADKLVFDRPSASPG
jgi:putative flippase GtrA